MTILTAKPKRRLRFKGRAGSVYLIRDNKGLCKIGYTQDVQKRLKTLRTGNPNYLQVVDSFQTVCASYVESYIHEKLGKYRVFLEWFDLPNLQTWRDVIRELWDSNEAFRKCPTPLILSHPEYFRSKGYTLPNE